ncbi:MAG: hypothetical protein B9S32_08980 [Verrucomicrobia bacterium Tous-C9LFEB]|nr:MAG: hypothetical protein B9S32_08980 [Verrucomicrobia bacterium Tous-C9LFEB]
MKHYTFWIMALLVMIGGIIATPAATWVGNGDANNGGNWSTTTNWDGSVPGATDTATLGNVTTGTRTVVYDSASSGFLTSLQLEQSTASAINKLSIQRDLTLSSELVIGASAGSSIVRLGGAASKVTLQVGDTASSPGITLNSGGTFILDFISGGVTGSDLKSNVTINTGGVFQVGSSESGSSSSTAQATVVRSMTLSGGQMVLDTTDYSAIRLSIQGNFTATGGSISTTSGSGGNLYFDGTTVSLGNTSIGSVNFTMRGSGNKTLSIDRALNRLYLIGRNSADLTVNVSAPSTTGLYFTHESVGKTVTMQLTSDLALATNGVQPQATGGATSGTTTYGIDANGFTLDLTAGQSYGKWTPNKGSETTAAWELTTSAANGRIKATAFDFSTTNVTTHVGAGLILEAVSGSNATTKVNNLSGTGVIETSSVFRFNPTSSASTSTLQSNRDIGILEIKKGTLSIAGTTDFSAKGGIAISAGATLNLDQRMVSTSLFTFGVSGTDKGVLTGGNAAVSLADARIVFDLSGTIVAGTYDVFDTISGITGTPSSVAISGNQTLELTRSGTTWSGSSGGFDYTFSTDTGLFQIAAVPEPRTKHALLIGSLLLLVTGVWRQHRHHRA